MGLFTSKYTSVMKISELQVSHLIPQGRFKEQLVRVFLKPTGDVDTDSRSQQWVEEAFTAWCGRNNMKEPKVSYKHCIFMLACV